ncbi:MAG: hypothetical protein EBU84_09645 [Actinobacteria bacterium]|nr:hypothetical protein [Actinomycetota bacterium]
MDKERIRILKTLGIDHKKSPQDILSELKSLRVLFHPDKWLNGPPKSATEGHIIFFSGEEDDESSSDDDDDYERKRKSVSFGGPKKYFKVDRNPDKEPLYKIPKKERDAKPPHVAPVISERKRSEPQSVPRDSIYREGGMDNFFCLEFEDCGRDTHKAFKTRVLRVCGICENVETLSAIRARKFALVRNYVGLPTVPWREVISAPGSSITAPQAMFVSSNFVISE